MTPLPSYPAYKDSGVPWLGKIPAHWEVFKLRHILRRFTERNQSDLPLLSVVREKGVILRDTSSQDENRNYIPDDLSNYKVVRCGQFAMNKMKAWQGSYGVSKFDGIVSPAYFVFNVSKVDGDFFHSAIRSRAYVPSFAQASDGVRIDQWDLSEPRMREIRFLIPSLPEQHAITRYLDHVDRRIRRTIRARQKLIALLEEQKQAVIHLAVTGQIDVRTGRPYPVYKPSGVEWLGEAPEHWDVAALRHRYSSELGKMLDAKRITGDHLLPYVRNIDVQWDRVNTVGLAQMDIASEEYARYTLDQGDLLVCEGGEVGRCAIWSGEIPLCGYQKAIHRVRSLDRSRDNARHLLYVMRAGAKIGVFLADGSENTIAHLTGVKLRRHRFAFPPKHEQDAIVT